MTQQRASAVAAGRLAAGGEVAGGGGVEGKGCHDRGFEGFGDLMGAVGAVLDEEQPERFGTRAPFGELGGQRVDQVPGQGQRLLRAPDNEEYQVGPVQERGRGERRVQLPG